MASAQTTLITAGPAVIKPNCYQELDRDLFVRDLFYLIDGDGWQTGVIIEFGKYARFAAVRLSRSLAFETTDPEEAVKYLNHQLANPDRRLPGWRFALKPSALILEFDQERADRDLEEGED